MKSFKICPKQKPHYFAKQKPEKTVTSETEIIV